MSVLVLREDILSNTSVGLNHENLKSFGPVTAAGFDFTPLFEDTILSLVPSALLLLCLPYRIISLHGQRPKVSPGGFLRESKQAFLAMFAVIHLALLILHVLSPSLRTATTIAASALAFIASLGLCLLSHLEHSRSIRPSPIINGYILLTLVFDIARVRTLFLDSNDRSISGFFACMISVKVMVLLAEAIEKRGILLAPYRDLSPEETSGIYSKSFFFWLNELMTSGFRRVLHNHDLYPIDRDMSSEVLHQRMKHSWSIASQDSRRALFWAVLRANFKPLVYCVVPRLFQIGFRYAQPFLLTRTISFAGDESQPDSIGWGLAGAFFVVLLGVAISNGLYYHMTYRFVTSARGNLISLIYAKTVDLSITALDESVAVTLMSSDVQSICNGFEEFNNLWAMPIELTIALYLLARQLGIASIAPAALALVSTVAIMSIAKFMGLAQKVWMESIQTRVDVTATMLGSMKSVKMLGFTDWLAGLVQGLRVKELKEAELFRKLLIVRVFLANILFTLGPFVTFAIYALHPEGEHVLNADTAYTVLTLLSLLARPVNDFIRSIPSMNAALASLNRIQEFLQSETRRDHRIFLEESPKSRQHDQSSSDGIELTNLNRSMQMSSSEMIVARDVSVSWKQDADFSVHDVNLSVAKGQIHMIIGPTGCGKSTLIKGILGETPSTKGFLYTNCRETAFVDQTPWIRNTSLKDNILGASVYNEVWYNEVVRACVLDQDVAQLPNGHLTKVGSSGISLSGGQKQRLALARAVYARKDLVMLDDVFSGLDADTEERIFTSLFSRQGLFRRLGTTVLLVTHAVHRLSYADHIIAMGSEGSIVEQGRLEELEASGGYVTLLKSRYRSDTSDDQTNTQQNQAAAVVLAGSEDASGINTMEEELTRQNGDFSLYLYYFGSVHWASTVVWMSCFILQGVAIKLSEFLVNFWTSSLEKSGSSVNGFYLGLYGMLTMITTVGLVGGVHHYILFFAPRSAQSLHERLLRSVMNAPLSFFTSVDIGSTTNRFSQDMTLIDHDLPYSVTDFVLSLSMGLMSAILMCVSARYFAAVMPAVFLFMWMLQKFYLRTSRQMRLLDLEAKSPLFSQFIESLSGLVTIRAFGWASAFENQNLALLDASQKPFYLLFCIQRWLELALDLSVAVLGAILMVLVVKLRSDVGAGYVGLAILNVITFSQSLSQILRNWANLETSIGAIARIRDFVANTANENRTGESERPITMDNDLSSWPSKGKIEFRNVYASYKTGEDQRFVLRGLNLSIEPGQKIGICGRSGSGKSSLLASLFRMLEVDPKSQILIDGVDITRISRQTTRTALNAIPQEPFFTHGTVRANMDPWNTKTPEQIEEALRRVELWETVETKGGLNAALDANFFSHGQRQLFCLARALLRGSKVIVLDEVTSNVDVVSDALMQRIIREQFADSTILAVAHRLETIMDFDRIAVIRDGELIEFDTPKALLEKESAFKGLYES
ncbi:hypothetical protein N7474_005384 [Penicillium riverlandense]|uniref:uncharacterized protein n=1 Tax=Penicillium riverlandense TaxID=1903569 RepID=UPI002548384A|nr:uncharacterized protein N7474_005384 [Penicillium riverlandense]KAJ5819793.1 hypothetical protein N7474_005384 [Penicillium riverlandense]